MNEFVIISKDVFEEMVGKFSRFSDRVNEILGKREEGRLTRWMDNQDVCQQLRISPRTLQTMRENGTLAYTKISHKVYYRPEDVKAVFPVAEMKRCITAGKERKCNVTNKQTSQPTNQPTNRYLTYE